MSQYVTIDEAYEIASEVAQKTITKFLSNLVKLVPDANETFEDIKAEQWRAYRENRNSKKSSRARVSVDESWENDVEDSTTEDDYMRRVYEEGRADSEDEEIEEDSTERVFEDVAHGSKGKVRNMNDIFPDEMEHQISLKDDHQMPSNEPAAN